MMQRGFVFASGLAMVRVDTSLMTRLHGANVAFFRGWFYNARAPKPDDFDHHRSLKSTRRPP